MGVRAVLPALRSLSIAIVSIAIVSFAVEAVMPSQSQNGSYLVSASIQPARYIVVDNNLQIKQVVSNTAQDVVPYVVLNTLDGGSIPYTNSVRAQFLSLKHSIDFSRAGVVYTRHASNSFTAAVQTALSAVRRFVFG